MKAIELIRRLSVIMESIERLADATEVNIQIDTDIIKKITEVKYDEHHGGDGIVLN